jgi:hypothetical protein
MDQSRMVRGARKGAQYGFVAAGGLAALGVMLGPRSMVLPIAGVVALPTFLPFVRWRAEYYGPFNEWAAILPCIVANWALVGGIAGLLTDAIRGRRSVAASERVAALESVVDALGSEVAQLQAHHEFDRDLAKPRVGPSPTRAP